MHRPPLPQEKSPVLLSEAESTSGHVVLSGKPRKKVPSDTTGNQSRDRPTSSALRYPRPHISIVIIIIIIIIY